MKKALLLILITVTSIITLSAQYHIAWVTAEPDTIYDDNNITYSEIEVCIQDENNDPVSGQVVNFDCNLGSCFSFVSTNSLGIAETTFWESNDGPGIATIFISVDNTILGEIEVTILELVSADDDIPLITKVTNYPNPFQINGNRGSGTTISFTLDPELRQSSNGKAEIAIYNIKGQLLNQTDIMVEPGKTEYSVSWDGNDSNGKEADSGIYFYLISYNNEVFKGKMTLLR